MTFEGQAVQVLPLDDGFVELRFDLKGDSVNKYNTLTLGELKEAVAGLGRRKDLRGVLLTSGKDGACFQGPRRPSRGSKIR